MKSDYEKLIELSELVLESALYWTGDDEEKNPKLKRLRTLAGVYFHENREGKK
jgi:hypothetical protein